MLTSYSTPSSGGSSVQFSSVIQLCPSLCNPINCSTPGLPVHHQLPESTQTHVHCIGDAIQPSHPLLSPSPPAFNLSQHQGLFQGSILRIGQSIEISASESVLPTNIQDCILYSVQFSSVAQSCQTLCDPTNLSTPGLPVHCQLQESTQTYVHQVGDAIQPSHPLSSPSPPALNLSQHQGLFK